MVSILKNYLLIYIYNNNIIGKDCTDLISVFHGKIVYKYLPQFYIGDLEYQTKPVTEQEKKSAALVKDFRELNQKLKRDGLYKIRYSYQVMKTMLILLFWAIVWAFYIYGYKYESVTLQLMGAVAMAVFLQQTAFIAHDAGHNLISHN